MIHRWLRWLAPVILGAALGLPCVPAQEIQRGHSAQPRDPSDDGSRTAALPYTVAGLATILVMVIVCTPSRKS